MIEDEKLVVNVGSNHIKIDCKSIFSQLLENIFRYFVDPTQFLRFVFVLNMKIINQGLYFVMSKYPRPQCQQLVFMSVFCAVLKGL